MREKLIVVITAYMYVCITNELLYYLYKYFSTKNYLSTKISLIFFSHFKQLQIIFKDEKETAKICFAIGVWVFLILVVECDLLENLKTLQKFLESQQTYIFANYLFF